MRYENTSKIILIEQIERSLEDLTISFRAFLTYLSPFQRYGGLRKLKRFNTFLTASTSTGTKIFKSVTLPPLFNRALAS